MKQLSLLAAAVVKAATLHLPEPLRADVGEEGESKFSMLFPMGTFHNGGWPEEGITIDAEFCASIVKNWKKRNGPALPVDYLHRGGEEDLLVEDQVASGWIEDLEARKDGLWARIKWTPKARALILADEYRFISPEWRMDDIDGRTGKPQGPTLVGAGLVNRPAFQEMPRVAASSTAALPTPAEKAKEVIVKKDAIIALLAKAGAVLSPDVTDEVAQAALVKHFDDLAAAKTAAAAKEAAVLTAKANAESAEATLKAQLAAKDNELTTVTARVVTLEKAQLADKTAALQKRLIDEGRIVASAHADVASFVEARGIEAATAFFDKLPKGGVVALKAQGHGEGGVTADAKEAHDKLKAHAAELEKNGTPGGDAMRAAMRAHPELTAKAFAQPGAKS